MMQHYSLQSTCAACKPVRQIRSTFSVRLSWTKGLSKHRNINTCEAGSLRYNWAISWITLASGLPVLSSLSSNWQQSVLDAAFRSLSGHVWPALSSINVVAGSSASLNRSCMAGLQPTSMLMLSATRNSNQCPWKISPFHTFFLQETCKYADADNIHFHSTGKKSIPIVHSLAREQWKWTHQT